MANEPRFKIKDWEEFQHYKDRRPPWIKLHRSLFDKKRFMSLALASRGLLIQLWLIASESDGFINESIKDLAWRLRVESVDLKPLLDSGLLIEIKKDASTVLADDSKVLPRVEESRGEREKEAEEIPPTQLTNNPSPPGPLKEEPSDPNGSKTLSPQLITSIRAQIILELSRIDYFTEANACANRVDCFLKSLAAESAGKDTPDAWFKDVAIKRMRENLEDFRPDRRERDQADN